MEQIFYDFASRIKKNFIPTSRRISRQDTTQFMFWGHSLAHSCIFRFLDFRWSVILPVGKKNLYIHRYTLFWEISCSSSYSFQIHFENETIIGLSILVGIFMSWVLTRIDAVAWDANGIIIFLFPTQHFLPSVNLSQLIRLGRATFCLSWVGSAFSGHGPVQATDFGFSANFWPIFWLEGYFWGSDWVGLPKIRSGLGHSKHKACRPNFRSGLDPTMPYQLETHENSKKVLTAQYVITIF